MCGITGLIDYAGRWNCQDVAVQMTAAIQHRGPNGHGVFARENVALGHRRLSIIDLEGGRQPMSTPDGQVQLTYNGEVYNYRELRRELQSKGFKFRTSSDTEVVLFAYEAWGRRCVERFEGMFAFAIADFRRREILIARDHFGIKPLLYRIEDQSFAFASEFQALKQLPDWTGEIDLYSIDLYLRYQYIPAPQTAYRKTFKLPAGHRMVVGMDEPRRTLERYWQPDFSKKRKFKDDELLHELDEALRDSVRRHLVADVPFGAFLSGGIDSSLIVGYMAELTSQPVKTFSIGFEDDSINELQYARQVAKKYGTEHHEEIVRFDALDQLPEIVRHYGEPFGDQSAIPTWNVCRLARKSVPMVLCGDGGDEFFAGYTRYGMWRDVQSKGTLTPPKHSLVRRLRNVIGSVVRAKVSTNGHSWQSETWQRVVTRLPHSYRCLLWKPELRFLADRSDETLEREATTAFQFSDVNAAQYMDLGHYLSEDILSKVDIASMRFGLEARPPVLDRRVFEMAASVPTYHLFDAYDVAGKFSGKRPLKQLASNRFGDSFAHRPKQGFVLPLESWIRRNPKSSFAICDRLLNQNSALTDWFDTEQLRAFLHTAQPDNVWTLLVLDEWHRQAVIR